MFRPKNGFIETIRKAENEKAENEKAENKSGNGSVPLSFSLLSLSLSLSGTYANPGHSPCRPGEAGGGATPGSS